MKYAIIRGAKGEEIPLIFGNTFNVSKLDALGKVVAAGQAHVHHMTITCDGKIDINGKEVGSRGLKDEILLRSSDFMESEEA